MLERRKAQRSNSECRYMYICAVLYMSYENITLHVEHYRYMYLHVHYVQGMQVHVLHIILRHNQSNFDVRTS